MIEEKPKVKMSILLNNSLKQELKEFKEDYGVTYTFIVRTALRNYLKANQ